MKHLLRAHQSRKLSFLRAPASSGGRRSVQRPSEPAAECTRCSRLSACCPRVWPLAEIGMARVREEWRHLNAPKDCRDLIVRLAGPSCSRAGMLRRLDRESSSSPALCTSRAGFVEKSPDVQYLNSVEAFGTTRFIDACMLLTGICQASACGNLGLTFPRLCGVVMHVIQKLQGGYRSRRKLLRRCHQLLSRLRNTALFWDSSGLAFGVSPETGFSDLKL